MERLNGWKSWILGIVAVVFASVVIAAFGFSMGVSSDIATALERQSAQAVALHNVRERSIKNEQNIARIDAEWNQFKKWYQEDRKLNKDTHEKILIELKELRK